MGQRSIARRPATLLIAVGLGLALALAIDLARAGSLEAWLARRGIIPAYEARGRIVDVGGRDVYLDCRGTGEPTVILEAGLGSGASTWRATLDGIAAFTRVCAWDRPGIGRSEPRDLHSAADTAGDLRAALAAANEHGPYIVVAHSLGGVYGRVFSDGATLDGEPEASRNGVLAFVMVDTYEPDIGIKDDPTLPAEIRSGYARVIDDTGASIQAGEALDWARTLEELRIGGPVEQPAVMLTVDPYARYLHTDRAIQDAIVAAWLRGMAARYPNGTLEILPNTGHSIQLERPSVVIERLRVLVLSEREVP